MRRRLLIVGCGDVALRAAPLLSRRYRLLGLARGADTHDSLRSRGIVPIPGDLDIPSSLERLAGLADAVLHLAPPPDRGDRDTRTAHLLAALAKSRMLPQRLVYISTTGVYGNCRGAEVVETRAIHPETTRARRRADAESRLRAFGRRHRVCVAILRVPGIYAADRLPVERLKQGTPALKAGDDPYTNHIHAEDLARVAAAALERGSPERVYNVADDSGLTMGDYFDLVADRCGLPRPPRISWQEAQRTIPPTLLSFMGESRRLSNRRMRRELGVKLLYPTVAAGLAAAPGGLPTTC
ncbi:MAG: SDR family oxidoreductase [Betaproteobacteria bacterium]|nr:SDR family oxidoreductase [Betaproteobacteria bacterium]